MTDRVRVPGTGGRVPEGSELAPVEELLRRYRGYLLAERAGRRDGWRVRAPGQAVPGGQGDGRRARSRGLTAADVNAFVLAVVSGCVPLGLPMMEADLVLLRSEPVSDGSRRRADRYSL